MDAISISDPRVLVLTDDDEGGAGSNRRGHLFEVFIALLLEQSYGFDKPTRSDVSVTSEGIELDVVTRTPCR